MTQKSHKTSTLETAHTDIYTNSIILRILPNPLRPYAVLARLDRPVGYMLLWLPTVFGILLSGYIYNNAVLNYEIALYSFLFFIGAIAMRGAGCTWNDMADIEYDKKVERTQNRPLACGVLSKQNAVMFIIFQLAIGAGVWYMLPVAAKIASMVAVIPAIIYPFIKRFSYYPQIWLGLTFNWGIWVGWYTIAPVTDTLPIFPLILHIGAIFWTVGYDTIYAHQDKDDDVTAGVKSTALKFAEKTRLYVAICYSIFISILMYIGCNLSFNVLYYIIISGAGIWFTIQIYRLDIHNKALCLRYFKHNIYIGIIIATALLSAFVN